MAPGMDFFGHQERARRATGRLVVLFVLALLAIWLCIHFAASAVFSFASERADWFRPEVFLITGLATFAVVGGGMLVKTMQLAKGGSSVASMLGGKPVPIDTTDPKERLLRNVVEEMAIASGVPVPEVFVLENEAGINAFAAGWSSADAAVAVTRGCLDQFDRDELQGVIAHEFSHVFHGDMRLNIRLMGVLFGIVCITTIGRIIVESLGRGARISSSNKKGNGAAGILLFGVALIVIGWLGVLFARLIQAAVSRHREFLADASAVQYTRNPRGIGLALAKLGGLGGTLHSAQTEAASHMLFGDGMRRYFGGAFATHPPIEERVERVLPGFRRELASRGSMLEAAANTPLRPGAAGLVGVGPVVGVPKPVAEAPPPRVGADALLASIGDPQPEQVEAARDLLRSFPLEVAIATREPRRAAALVHALLLDRDAAAREAQRQRLETLDTETAHEAQVLFRLLVDLPARSRLPLLELAMPALRALPPGERATLRTTARALATSDGRILPFEFAMLQLIHRHVRLPDEPPPRALGRPTSLAQHPHEVALVLSALAHVGAADPTAAATAFARGAEHLGVPQPLELRAAAECRMEALEGAVNALGSVSPLGKRNLLSACAATAGSDGHLTIDEADVLRALAGLWDCPIPIVAASPSSAA